MFRRRRRLEHRVALVTGGARGIGRAIVKALLAEGLTVAIADRDEVTANKTARELSGHGTVRAWALDVTDAAAFRDVVARVEVDLGPVDVLVNNAGIMPLGAFLDQDPGTDDLQIDINLRGVIHGMRAVLPGMVDRGRGHIVNIASLAGRVPAPFAAVYVGVKHAVVGLTEAVRAEYGERGVDFSYVMPALVKTELISGAKTPRFPPPVTPERVARDLVGALHSKRVDVYVPRFGKVGQVIPALLPRSVYEPIGRFFKVDQLFAEIDHAARKGYRERILGRAGGGAG